MAISGYFLPSAPGADRRNGGRRKLSLLAKGSRHDGSGIDVQIHNISGTGLLFESDIKLVAGDRIEIELPHAGDITALVIWASGRHFGCQFEGPVSRATLSAVELKSATDAPPGGQDEQQEIPAPEADEGFGDRLERLRGEAGLERADIARQMDVSAASVLGWEKGRALPKRSRMAALATILGVPTAELTGEAEPDKVRALIDDSRKRIAQALGVHPDKVRITVEF